MHRNKSSQKTTKPLLTEEEHVLEEVAEALQVRRVVVAPHVHEQGRRRLAEAVVVLVVALSPLAAALVFAVRGRALLSTVVAPLIVGFVVVVKSPSPPRAERRRVADEEATQPVGQDDVAV